MKRITPVWFGIIVVMLLPGCSGSNGTQLSSGGGGSVANVGGSTDHSGGTGTVSASSGGASATGGSKSDGGTTVAGGALGSGGLSQTGGSTNSGGAVTSGGGTLATGGMASPGGGVQATGGAAVTGGSTATGGSKATGGSSSTGGARPTGGSPATGGALSTGGTSSGVGGTVGGSSTGGAPVGTGGSSNPGGPSYPFIFSVFNDSAAVSSLQIYTSNDALNFTLLTDTGYTGPTTNLRDPSIMKHTDGKFYVAFTTPPAGNGCCGAQSSFSIASSSDLKSWATVATVPSGIAGVTNVWAPEWFKDSDGSLHILVTINQSNTYRYEPTDSTLTKFGAGKWIGIGPDYIDTFIVKIGATYHAFPKRESTTYIEHATATSIDGPWTFVGTGNWAGWGNHKEAPSLIQLGNGTWRMFCDAGSAGHEMYSDSTDTFQTWTTMKALPTVGANISHGTVID